MRIVLVILACLSLAAVIYAGSARNGTPAVWSRKRSFIYIQWIAVFGIYIAMFILLIRKYEALLLGLLYAVMLAVLLATAFLDVREKRISKKVLLLLLPGGLAAIVTDERINVINGAVAMLTVFAVLWIIYRVSKGSFGLGDVLLCTATAPYLGTDKVFSMLMLATIMCGITALMLVAADRNFKNESLPFAPFVAVSTAAVLLL